MCKRMCSAKAADKVTMKYSPENPAVLLKLVAVFCLVGWLLLVFFVCLSLFSFSQSPDPIITLDCAAKIQKLQPCGVCSLLL